MIDYTYQSVYFAYLLFAVFAAGAVYFFVRSVKDGYLGPNSEEPKYRMLRTMNRAINSNPPAPARRGGRDDTLKLQNPNCMNTPADGSLNAREPAFPASSSSPTPSSPSPPSSTSSYS